MPPVLYLYLVTVMKDRLNVISTCSSLGQGSQRVQRRECSCRRLQLLHFRPYRCANAREQLSLKLDNSLFGSKYLAFPLFQLRSCVPFRICKGLPALIIVRYSRDVPLRNLNIVTEYVVEPDLEVTDPGSLPLEFFKARYCLLCVLGDSPQLIQLGIKPAAYRSA